jgi:hypothetical protein
MTLRLWVRIRDSLWGWDDAFVVLAGMASLVGDCFVCLSKASAILWTKPPQLTVLVPGDGLGLHLWTLGLERLSEYFRVRIALLRVCDRRNANIAKHIYVTNIAYCCSATFIKLAILFQYLRLFAESSSSTTSAQYILARRVTIGLITISSLWGLTFLLLAIFPCNPIAKDWKPALPGTCIGWGSKNPDEFFQMFVGHSASNMVLDLMVLMVPVPFLSMLRISGKSKAGLITLFAFGAM